jgi:hypothetical protein
MSRLLYRLSYPAVDRYRRHAGRTTHVDVCGIPSVRGSTEVSTEPPCGIEPQTFSLPWRRSAD